MNSENPLYVEKYRPRTIEDCILPKELKDSFAQFVKNGELPNLLLSGSAGVGKTTVARAILEQIGADYIVINGSMNGNIDTLRNEILQFASSVSFTGGRKYVILDEADYLNCLEENEKVRLSNGNAISLKDMNDGEQYNIISFNMKDEKFENDIAEVIKRSTQMVYDLELENGIIVRLTGNHPIICKDSGGNIVTRTIDEGLDEFEIVTIEK
jgi:hypothetical protein